MTRATYQWSVCRTVFLFLAGISLIGFSLTAYAQPNRLPRIGVVSATAGSQISTPTLDGFREGLRELGYSDGKNIILEYRYAEGRQERVPSFIAEFVQLNVDLILVGSSPVSGPPSTQRTRSLLLWSVLSIRLRQGRSTAWLARVET